jgi:hypothetical protein
VQIQSSRSIEFRKVDFFWGLNFLAGRFHDSGVHPGGSQVFALLEMDWRAPIMRFGTQARKPIVQMEDRNPPRSEYAKFVLRKAAATTFPGTRQLVTV